MPSTTSLATVRPNRAIQACWSGSAFSMVPVAVASAIRALVAFESVSVMVSPPSSIASSRTGTEMVLLLSPGSNVSVPLVAV